MYLKQWIDFREIDVLDICMKTCMEKEEVEDIINGKVEPTINQLALLSKTLDTSLDCLVYCSNPRSVKALSSKVILYQSNPAWYRDQFYYTDEFTIYTNNHSYAVRLQRWMQSQNIKNDIYVVVNQTPAEKYFQTPVDELFIIRYKRDKPLSLLRQVLIRLNVWHSDPRERFNIHSVRYADMHVINLNGKNLFEGDTVEMEDNRVMF